MKLKELSDHRSLFLPTIVIFLSLFPFRLFGTINTVTLALTLCLPSVVKSVFFEKTIVIKRDFVFILIVYTILISSIFYSQIVNQEQNGFLNIIISTFVSYIIISLFLSGNYENEKIYKSIIISVFTQCVIALLITLSDFFRNFFTLLINNPEFWESFYGVRLYGLGIKSFPLGVNIAIGCLFIVFYINETKPKLIKNVILLGLFSLFCLCALVSARSSVLVIAMSLLAMLIISPTGFIKLFCIQLAFLILFLILGYFYLPDVVTDKFIGTTLPWLLEILNSSESQSLNMLKDMYVFPTNIKTMLIGDGLLTNSDGTYYMHSDVGYVRVIYYAGITGLALMSVFFLLLNITALGQHHILLILFFSILFFALNLKGLLFFYSSYTFIAFLLASKGMFYFKAVKT